MFDWLIKALGGYTYSEHRRMVREQREMMKYSALHTGYDYARGQAKRRREHITDALEKVSDILDETTTERGRIIMGEDDEQRLRAHLLHVDDHLDEHYEDFERMAEKAQDSLDELGDDT